MNSNTLLGVKRYNTAKTVERNSKPYNINEN